MHFVYFLGFSRNAYGEETASNTHGPKTDKEAGKFLKELSERKRPSDITSHKYNIRSGTDLPDIVTTRFRKEMTILFFSQPNMDQCKLLTAVSKATFCSVSDIVELLSNLTEVENRVNVSCPFDHSVKHNMCSLSSRHKVVNTIDNELLKVFATLPSPFKCHVINTIALAYNHLKGRRNLASSSLTLSVSKAQNELANIFPSVKLPKTCADVKISIPSVPPVNITVNLTSGDRTTWLLSLTKKGPAVYRTVLEYERENINKVKVLGPGSTAQYLAENKELINSAQIVIVGVFGGSRRFSVLFKLKVRRTLPNPLREMKSTYKIVRALAAKKQTGLRQIFNATIITISLSGERSNITKTPPKTNKWTLNQIDKGKELFPADLSEYYKQLGKPARCFIVVYISKKIKKSPEKVEMFYVSFGRLSRKHSCYYTWRIVHTDTPIEITEERFTQEKMLTTRVPSVTNRTVVPPSQKDSALDNISEMVIREDFSTLEIALFTLLGLLCAAILTFTISCVVSALKSKSTQNNAAPSGAVQTAVFPKDTNTATAADNESDSVHFITRMQRSGRPDSQHLHTMGSSNKMNHNCLKLHSLPQSDCIGGFDERTCSRTSQSEHNSSGENISTNVRTHKENEYCIDSSQLHDSDNAAMESPWKKRNSCKTACQHTRKKVHDHSVQVNDSILESQGKAITYCSITNTSCKTQPQRTVDTGCPLSEDSLETVVVLLDTAVRVKEAQV